MNNTEVRYLGSLGSYSHEIALTFIDKYNLSSYDLNSYETITQLISQESLYEECICILPLENTTSGDVYETYYQCFINGYDIIDSLQMEIKHVLIVKNNCDINQLKHVYSHPQALLQVSSYLQLHKLIALPEFSTADALKRVSLSNEHIGAIASSHALKYYDNLIVLENEVANNQTNYTRFLISRKLKQKENYQVNLNHTNKQGYLFLLFELQQDKSGELTVVLDLLSKYNINLFSIKSRPTQRQAFEYFFVVEAMIEEVSHDLVVDDLKKITKSFIYNTYNH